MQRLLASMATKTRLISHRRNTVGLRGVATAAELEGRLLDWLGRCHMAHEGGKKAGAASSPVNLAPSSHLSGLGYRLGVAPSTILNAGRGLFLVEGKLAKGDIITMYPGSIYRIPHDLEAFMHADDAWAARPPEFMMANDYLIEFVVHGERGKIRQLLVDGCPKGLSKSLFTTIVQREGETRNTSWLEEEEVEGEEGKEPQTWQRLLSSWSSYIPAAMCAGYLINDPGHGSPNVCFELGIIPWSRLPDYPYLPTYLGSIQVSKRWVKKVGLCVPMVVAKEDLVVVAGGGQGQELFVKYGQDPTHMGYFS